MVKISRKRNGMDAIRLSLLPLFMLTCAHTAYAKTSEESPIGPLPAGSPGNWIGSDDYPAVALRFNMTGVTAFKLVVDPVGKPSRCDIVESSGFDVLDSATCQRLMANAQFTPLHNREGKPIEGTYSSRVKWVVPDGGAPAISESFGSMLLSIDQTGKVTSCRIVVHIPITKAASTEKPCGAGMQPPPPALAMEFRGNYQGASAEVEIQQADFFTPALRTRLLSPMLGYEQRALNVHRFKITKDGKLGQCSYEEQRGSQGLATNYCMEVRDRNFDPPFSAFDKDGVASGWHIARVLLKTGK